MRANTAKANTAKYETLATGASRTPSRLATSLTLAAMSLGYGVVQLDVTIFLIYI